MTDPIQAPILVSPGSQLLAVLLAGLLMTFGFQLLLTNLGVLVSLVILKFPLTQSIESEPETGSATDQSAGASSQSQSALHSGSTIGFLAGIGILLSTLTALMPASFLAVKLGQIHQPLLGAVAGLVLWAAYILILTWLSSRAVNSVIQFLFGGLIKGVGQLISTIASLFPDASAKDAQAAERSELEIAIASLNTRLETYLNTLAAAASPPDDSGQAPSSSVSQPSAQLTLQSNFSRSDSPDSQSLSSLLKSGVERLVDQVDAKTLLQRLLQQVDLSDWDMARIWQQFQQVRQQLTGAEPDPLEVLPEEVEHYLLTMPLWALKPAALAEELPDLLYDAEANPMAMQQQLRQLDANWFLQRLQQRQDLPAERLPALVATLEQLQQAALAHCAVDKSELDGLTTEWDDAVEGAIATLQSKLSTYLLYTNLNKLTRPGIQEKLQSLVDDAGLDLAVLRQALPALDVQVLEETLNRRRGLKKSNRQAIIDQIQTSWDALLPAPTLSTQIVATLQTILPDQDTITLEDLKPHLITLLQSPSLAAHQLGQSLTQLDWAPLQQLLSDYALDSDQIQTTVDWVQEQVFRAARLPRRWVSRLGDKTQFWPTQIQRYLRYQEKAALTPEQIQDDLKDLIALWSWIPVWGELPAVAIATTLRQRQDLTPNEMTQITTALQSAWVRATDQLSKLHASAQANLEPWGETFANTLESIPWPSADFPDKDAIQQDLSEVLSPLSQTLHKLSHSLTLWLPNSSLKILKQYLQDWNEEFIHQLIETRDDLSSQVQDYLETQITHFRQSLEQELHQLESQALQQINQLRRTAVTATGWLLGIILSTALGASLAGLLATNSFFNDWIG